MPLVSVVTGAGVPRGARRISLSVSLGELAALQVPEQSPSETRGTVLLVPGFTGSKEDFREILPLLADSGWHATAIDQRGQYESVGSDNPDDFALDVLAGDIIDIVDQLVDQTGRPVHLLGHSFGGIVTRRAATLIAEQGDERTRLASLLLMSSGPGQLPADVREVFAPLRAALPNVSLETIWQATQEIERANGIVPPYPELTEFFHQRFVKNSPAALGAMADILLTSPDTIDEFIAARDSGLPDLPVMVMFGMNDTRWTINEQAEMARRIGARVGKIADAAHSPAVEQPVATAAMLEAAMSDAADAKARSISHQNAGSGFAQVRDGYSAFMELSLPVTAGPTAIGPTRRAVGRQLTAWGLADRCDDTELIVSELITNAMRYGSAPVDVKVRVIPTGIRLEVTDQAIDKLPEPRQAAEYATNGRGFELITALSSDWGVEVDEAHGSKTVWVELAA